MRRKETISQFYYFTLFFIWGKGEGGCKRNKHNKLWINSDYCIIQNERFLGIIVSEESISLKEEHFD